MKTTLAIMAAGIGSRYGAGIKQLAQVGPTGEIIMDYSVHDAVEAGFNRIVFIIRHEIEEEFREVIGERIEALCAKKGVEVAYAFQELEDIPAEVPAERTKPWGTGQAILAARDVINEPFAVINADDYYGKEAFVKIHEFLEKEVSPEHFCMAGFVLRNTLSDHGTVTRGICEVGEDDYLTNVTETYNIEKTADGAVSEGGVPVDIDACCSMNMWGLAPEFMQTLKTGLDEFLATEAVSNPLKSEYLLPIYIGELLQKHALRVKMLTTNDRWFGITYQEDKAYVIDEFRKLIEAGQYEPDLFAHWR